MPVSLRPDRSILEDASVARIRDNAVRFNATAADEKVTPMREPARDARFARSLRYLAINYRE